MIFPMATMVFYIWAMAVATFVVRKRFIEKDRSVLKYFKVYNTAHANPPEMAILVGQHYDNLLQLPLLFLVTGVVCLLYKLENPVMITLGWAFIVSRLFHTYVHLGSNHILKRAIAFGVGWSIVMAMWLLILAHLLYRPGL